MNITDYRKEEYFVVASDIAKHMDFDYTTQKQIEQYLQFSRYYIFSTRKRKTTSILYRFTFPFLMLLYLFLFIIKPIKWLFTGNSNYNSDGRLVKFIHSWNDKIYPEKIRII